MDFRFLLGMALIVSGTAYASITSVGGQAITIGDSTAPTTLDLDQDGQADFSLYAYKKTILTYTYDYIQVQSLAPLATVMNGGAYQAHLDGRAQPKLSDGDWQSL